MYENYTELSVDGLTSSTSLQGAHVLLLREKDGSVLVALPLDATGYRRVQTAVKRKDYTSSHLMLRLAELMGLKLLGVRVLPPSGGITQGRLDFEDGNVLRVLDVPIADAVVASLESGCSLWAAPAMIEAHRKRHSPQGTVGLPLRGMEERLLRQALESAVAEDNFELAALIRDELKSREEETDNASH